MPDTELIDHLHDAHRSLTHFKASFLVGLGEFASRELCRERGSSSPISWLSRECGIARRTAYEYLHVANKLRDFPLVAAEFLAATISYSKVRLLLRYLSADNEAELVDLALTLTLEGLEHALAGRPTTTKSGKNAAEYFKVTTDEETGDLKFWGRLKADRGAELLAALKIGELASLRTLVDLPKEGVQNLHQLDPGELEELVEKAHETPEAVASHQVEDPPAKNDPESADGETPSEAEPPRRGTRFGPPLRHAFLQSLLAVVAMVRAAPRSQVRAPGAEVMLKVSADHYPHLIGKPGAEVKYLYRQLLNAHTQLAVIDETGVPVYVGRRNRTVNAAQEKFLLMQWGGQCATPGCVHIHFLEFHHIVAWAAGGGTDVDNLIPLCSACHSMVSAGILQISIPERDPAKVEFRFPDGAVFISERRGIPMRADQTSEFLPAERVSGDSFDDAALDTA
ncbi:HNH endonuclease [Corynebacterium sp. A21]|uniref:HNH endonuclease n=1 Tax=Corynebacterium sp. A21 TaxID=3457318 RepID=UPI003FD55237